ncbi:MAG: hypothetical protein NTV34_12735 [Proteobacteria bacterium]|nr:hypothetical protein [Pseudomonadota bacterium]
MKPQSSKFLQTFALVMFFCGLCACAQKLPREVTNNRPVAVGEPLDVNGINLFDLASGESINLGKYMDDHKLKFMLLTFGSRSCEACLEKAEYLEANLVENGQQLGPAGDSFEVRGVNVDPSSNHQLVVDMVKQLKLSHMVWSDPSVEIMMRYFQPPNLEFGVPLSAMIDRNNLLWRISSKEHLTPEELVRMVVKTLGENIVVAPVTPPPVKPPVVILPNSILADERSDRLSALPVLACKESSFMSADDIYYDAGLKFLLVDRDQCAAGSVCAQNMAIISEFMPLCAEKACKSITLAEKAVQESDACDVKIRKGGKEIFETFADHFNWQYQAAGEPLKVLPDVKGPVTLVFDSNGKIVFSHEGLLTSTQLRDRWTLDRFAGRAKGPNFRMFSDQGESSFASWRHQAEWSLVIFWDTLCESCKLEITEWHKPEGVLAYCRTNPEFCQVASLDTAIEWDNDPASLPQYLEGVKHGGPNTLFDGFDALGWNMPLYVDPIPKVGSSLRNRWFESWVNGRFTSSLNRSVLYDREGKVRGSWTAKPGETGALDFLKGIKEHKNKE